MTKMRVAGKLGDDVGMAVTNDDDFSKSGQTTQTRLDFKEMTRLGAGMRLRGSLNTRLCCAS